MIYYSPSDGGFYHDQIHADIPEDAFEISADMHAMLLDAQTEGKTIKYVDGELTAILEIQPTTWEAVRSKRNSKLSSCDWTQLPDSPLTASEKEAWGVYRQALRDMTESFSDPNNVVWPEEPA